MYKTILVSIILSFILPPYLKAQSQYLPSNTLPILYINTENSEPVVTKESYINATYWLDPVGIEGINAIGNADDPLPLKIKGRGNYTWKLPQKPYRLKFDKKQEVLGMPSNKHWVLLASYTGCWNWLSDVAGKYLANGIDLGWVPRQQPVEVILNNEYIGLYHLSEKIRIDKNRLEIYEQADKESDPDLISGGWLVEIDNYSDPNQIIIPETGNTELWIKYHTPEVLSEIQKDWLTKEFTDINALVYNGDSDSDKLFNHLDIISLARYFILHEILDNCDGFRGSWFLHKDIGPDAKWICGPVWDLSIGYDSHNDFTVNYLDQPHWIREILNRKEFRQQVLDEWNLFYNKEFTPTINKIRKYALTMGEASIASGQRWNINMKNIEINSWVESCIDQLRVLAWWFDQKINSPGFIDSYTSLPHSHAEQDTPIFHDGKIYGQCDIYDISGKLISHVNGEYTLSQRGIYIIKSPSGTIHKILF